VKYKNKLDLIVRTGKTAFIAGGSQTLKAGAIVIFFNDATDLFSINKVVHYGLVPLCIGGVAYARFFTRTLTLWDRFKPKDKERSDYTAIVDSFERDAHTIKKKTNTTLTVLLVGTYVVGITRALFLAMNAYVCLYALMRFIGVKDGLGILLPGLYVVLTNFINFLSYNVAIMVKNSSTIYNTFSQMKAGDEVHKIRLRLKNPALRLSVRISRLLLSGLNIVKTIFVASFGLIALALYSYHLTKKALRVIPVLKLIPDDVQSIIATTSAAVTFISMILSKGLTLHRALAQNPVKIIRAVDKKARFLIPPHIISGVIYTLSLSFIYYVSGANIFNAINCRLFSPTVILSCLAIAISGGLLEYSFTALKMYDYISKKVDKTEGIERRSARTPFISPFRFLYHQGGQMASYVEEPQKRKNSKVDFWGRSPQENMSTRSDNLGWADEIYQEKNDFWSRPPQETIHTINVTPEDIGWDLDATAVDLNVPRLEKKQRWFDPCGAISNVITSFKR
jgi:hypothetical protein